MRLRHIVIVGLCGALLFWKSSTGLLAATPLSLDAGGGVQPWDYMSVDWVDPYGTPSTWVDGSDARFIGAAGTVSVLGTINFVNSIAFTSSNYILSGGTLTLTGTGGSITTQVAGIDVIDSVIAGSVGLSKTGVGTLVLGSANTFTGDAHIFQGTLQLNSAYALQNATLDHNYGGTLSFGDVTEANLGGLKGTRSLTLANEASESVTLIVGGNGQSTTYSGNVSGLPGSALKKVGSGTLTVSGSLVCDTIVSQGTLQLGSSGGLAFGTLEMDGGSLSCGTLSSVTLGGLKGNGNLALDGVQLAVGYSGQSSTYNGVLSGSMSLTGVGPGTLTLNGENTFSGDTLISAGAIKLGTPKALQNSTLDYSQQGVLAFGSLTNATLGGLKGNRSLTLTNDYGAPVTLSAGGNGQSTTFSGNISGSVGSALRKTGAGTLTLSGSIICDTIVSQGTVLLGTQSALQASTVQMDGGSLSCGTFPYTMLGGLRGSGNLALNGVQLAVGNNNQSTTYNGCLSGTTSLFKVGYGNLTLGGENTFSGDTLISTGTLTLGTANALRNSTLDYSSSGSLSFGSLADATLGGLKGSNPLYLYNESYRSVTLKVGANGQSTTYNGSVGGPTGAYLEKVGSGILAVGGPVQCDVIVSEGTLQVNVSPALQNSILRMAGGSLSGGTLSSVVLGGLMGSGNLTMNDVELVVGNYTNIATMNYDGVLSGTMRLTKSGNGTLTLNGENDFSGDTRVSSGAIRLGNANALQNSTLDFSTGTISFGSLTGATFGGLKGNRPLVLRNDYSVPVTLSVGENGQSTTYSGAISGVPGSAFRKVGSGTLTFSGSVLSGRDTIISEGTLLLGTPTALQGSIVEMGGGILSCGAFPAATLGGLKGSGNLALDGVQLNVGYSGTSTTYNGILSGTMALTKIGSGTLTLGGANTFTGDTSISAGTLKLDNPNALQNSTLNYFAGTLIFGPSSITLGGLKGSYSLSMPLELTVGGNNQSTTYTGSIGGEYNCPPQLRKVGSGTLTLGGQVYYCDTIISQGAIQVGSYSTLGGSVVEMDGGSLSCGLLSTVAIGGLRGHGNLALDGVQLEVGSAARPPDNTTYNGILSGSMSLIKVSGGTLTLNGQNTFSGDTRVNEGVLKLGTPRALQNSTLDCPEGKGLSFGSLTDATLGGLRGSSYSYLTLVNENSSPVTLAAGANGQSSTFSGYIDGPVGSSLKKIGSGTLTLSGSISCDTVISEGAIQFGTVGALQSSTLKMDGGSLSCGPFASVTIGGLAGDGNLTLDGVQLAVGSVCQPVPDTAYNGILAGTMSLVKAGSGALTLNGENTFSGDTIINGGVLVLGNAKALQNSTLEVTGGSLSFATLLNATVGGLKGTWPLDLRTWNPVELPVVLTVGGNGQSTSFGGDIAGPTGSALRKVGAGALTLSGANTCDTVISEGDVQLGAVGALQSSTVKMDGGSLSCGAFTSVTIGGLKGSGNLALDGVNLSVGNNNRSTIYNGVLSGSVALNKVGSGTLTLNGANTYSGDTAPVSGILKLGNTHALQNSTVDYDYSGLLRFGPLGAAVLGGLKGNRDLALVNDYASPVMLTVGGNGQSTVFSGAISGPTGAGIKKVGSGTLTLSGDNTYPGTTVLQQGQLTLTSAAQSTVLNLGGTDIQGGKLVFNYTGGPNPAATILDLLTDSYHGELWDVGQFQSTTAADAGLTLGWLDDGTSQVTVMLTHPGDFNLDGLVDDTDRDIIRANIGGAGNWATGDVNYDGQVNLLDWNLWKANVGLPAISGGSGSSLLGIPEPGTALLLVVGLLGLLTRVRKRRS
jgi:fibronectin-binding autotransporter adhesin